MSSCCSIIIIKIADFQCSACDETHCHIYSPQPWSEGFFLQIMPWESYLYMHSIPKVQWSILGLIWKMSKCGISENLWWDGWSLHTLYLRMMKSIHVYFSKESWPNNICFCYTHGSHWICMFCKVLECKTEAWEKQSTYKREYLHSFYLPSICGAWLRHDVDPEANIYGSMYIL